MKTITFLLPLLASLASAHAADCTNADANESAIRLIDGMIRGEGSPVLKSTPLKAASLLRAAGYSVLLTSSIKTKGEGEQTMIARVIVNPTTCKADLEQLVTTK